MRFFFRRRSLHDVLNATKTVKVCGIKFKIKKIDPLATMDGSKILQTQYDTYEGAKEKAAVLPSSDKVRAYFRDVLMACVVDPKLYRDQQEAIEKNGFWVEGLFGEWALVEGLHTAIMEYTYGKKNLKSVGLPKRT